MNKVIIMGRLTNDPEISESANGNIYGNYTVAVDVNDEHTDFIPCTVFGKSAEFAEKYFKKGMRVAVEGRYTTDTYTDRDGNKRYSTKVVVERQHFADGKKEEPTSRKGRR